MINVSKVLVPLSLRNQDLLREMDLDVVLILFTFGIFVLNIKDTEYTIMACREEYLVIEGDAKSFNWQTMGLNFEDLFPWVSKDLDGTWFIIFRDASKEGPRAMH